MGWRQARGRLRGASVGSVPPPRPLCCCRVSLFPELLRLLISQACRTHGTLQGEDPPESEDSREDRPLSPDLSRSTLTYPHQPSGLKAGCLPFGQDPAGGCREHLDPRPQQLLEEKEQAVAVLQEMVKVQ